MQCVVCRLDKDTSGLLLLTTHSDLIHTLTSPRHAVQKVYVVALAHPVAETERAAWVRFPDSEACLNHGNVADQDGSAASQQIQLREQLRERMQSERLASGELLLDGESKPCKPARIVFRSTTTACIAVTEGRYHQIRRMVAALGNHVAELHRESIGDLTLGELAPGEYRDIQRQEVAPSGGSSASPDDHSDTGY